MSKTENTRGSAVEGFSLLTNDDVRLFQEGRHSTLYEKLGSHLVEVDGSRGVYFAVWAPNAKEVSVIGDFNQWNSKMHKLHLHDGTSGIWEGFVSGTGRGSTYKYHLASWIDGYVVDKGDPFANYWETPPKTASIIWDLDYRWGDDEWMGHRKDNNSHGAPMTTYEVHLGSWRRIPEEKNRWLDYLELADQLPEYVSHLGFTHVELLPVMEHPFYGSWGYQTTGYFAPTSRYGTPQGMMGLVDALHKKELGVFLDWTPSHFPSDQHGLVYFDGTHLFEYADPRKGFQPDWKEYIFDYGRNEVRSFLLSVAHFWLGKYHADGLRTDAVSSMLYLDYSRKAGEWIPNIHGGRENLEAISFIRDLNETVYGRYPDVQMIAEESTAWPMVSRPTYVGGLGFGMKWNMGWMHDTLHYFTIDPLFRKYHHDELTFSMWYAFTENFVLSLSHDEVVYGKGSLMRKMPGDRWQQFANLRLLLGYMYGHPGKKLLFMGGELAQWDEWNHEKSLDWHLLEDESHKGMQAWVRDLNLFCKSEPALHESDFDPAGFEWVDFKDWEQSITTFLRMGKNPKDVVLVVCNYTPVPREGYRVGVPASGFWREVLNSDSRIYGGSGIGNVGGVKAEHRPFHGRKQSLSLTLPPLGVLFMKNEGV
jgi:1,4-alpha-glucan branching enzyme